MSISRAPAGSVIRDARGRAYRVRENGSLERLHDDLAAKLEDEGAERRSFLLVREPESSKYR